MKTLTLLFAIIILTSCDSINEPLPCPIEPYEYSGTWTSEIKTDSHLMRLLITEQSDKLVICVLASADTVNIVDARMDYRNKIVVFTCAKITPFGKSYITFTGAFRKEEGDSQLVGLMDGQIYLHSGYLWMFTKEPYIFSKIK